MTLNLDLRFVPFSCYGSYLSFLLVSDAMRWGSMPEKQGLYFRHLHGSNVGSADAKGIREIFQMQPCWQGQPIPFETHVTPGLLTISTARGIIQVTFDGPNVVRIRSNDPIGLELNKTSMGWSDNLVRLAENRWDVHCFHNRVRFMLTLMRGNISIKAPWQEDTCKAINLNLNPDNDSGGFECVFDDYERAWIPNTYPRPFETCADLLKKEVDDWFSRFPQPAPGYEETSRLAEYIHWNNTVGTSGLITRPRIVDSKNWMNFVWGWGNSILAMALHQSHPEDAWNMSTAFFDKQDDTGKLPDCYSDQGVVWGYTKPPIDGWALSWMMRRHAEFSTTQLRELYSHLSLMTTWWLNYMDDDKDGIPQYLHGNDSGWDNASCFDHGGPFESPDLSSYLILQIEFLADIAALLGRFSDAAMWRWREETLSKNFIQHCWNGERFICPRSGDHGLAQNDDSLLNFIPIILGHRLPEAIQKKLISGLKEPGRFLTDHGLATESLRSPFFKENGYWRGAVWPSSTVLILDGLKSCGEETFARDLARRYCEMYRMSGSAENFSALTGAGQRDRAYTWASSAFLILQQEFLVNITA